MSVQRFSSRRQPLDATFLNARLAGAKHYDRIAGYFSSSILEIAGEALERVQGPIRVVCNSELDPRDVETARAAQQAIRREWTSSDPEKRAETPGGGERFRRLYEFLRSKKLEVRVLPTAKFGLVHGKAGVIALADGRRTAFMGSANETRSAWKLNYELVWEDESPEAVQWVQEEFDALWSHPCAQPLADFVIEDIGRCARRHVVGDISEWRMEPEPAAAVVEAPVYRRDAGLWEHQKYFVKLAFDAHRTPFGARYVLADMVGLGKTVQLGLAALLMALWGDKPVLILCPPTLRWQWQGELKTLLGMPTAVWEGDSWWDENEVEHPGLGPERIGSCPRRVGIVSQGLVVRGSAECDHLLAREYECVIVDEAHRARRRNLGPGCENEKPEPNNLMRFLERIAPRTRSLLLGTATPMQIKPVEAWDLLWILARGREHVLGNDFAKWHNPAAALDLVNGNELPPTDEIAWWDWVRNPLPPASEDERVFGVLRKALGMGEADAVAPGEKFLELDGPNRQRVSRLRQTIPTAHHPFIRHIVRRTREFLETTINPETNEPYLKPVRVELLGEGDSDALTLPAYLLDAYKAAEAFCDSVKKRAKGAGGFLKTLLLRRVGSTLEAGKRTAEKMLRDWNPDAATAAPAPATNSVEAEDDDVLDEELAEHGSSELKMLTDEEKDHLKRLIAALETNRENDPKFQIVLELLQRGHIRNNRHPWLEEGCIIFSQYFDSIWWLGQQLTSGPLAQETIGIYAGAGKSGLLQAGAFVRTERETIKQQVRDGTLRLVLGTDAASEGLNLQRLGTLINLDLPWNPTRLEQRKGRIQRIGQVRDTVFVYNLRYRGSVEDRVHHLLSERLENIFQLFGQIPDVLEDVWVQAALGDIEAAKRIIDAVPKKHPFELKYHRIERVDWESCATVLDPMAVREALATPWE
ncbi:MAG: phospholipase D-like domain-containing anti-phage protein [Opitutaceae bacterium]